MQLAADQLERMSSEAFQPRIVRRVHRVVDFSGLAVQQIGVPHSEHRIAEERERKLRAELADIERISPFAEPSDRDAVEAVDGAAFALHIVAGGPPALNSDESHAGLILFSGTETIILGPLRLS